MNTLTINQKMFIAALVGFIIGATAVWVWSVAPTTQKSATTTPQSETQSYTDAKGGAAPVEAVAPVVPKVVTGTEPTIIAVSQPAGLHVAFSTMLQDAGWVVVHEDRDGELGNILGAQWLPQGTHAGEVTLLRATESGKTYHVVLYADDGDREFEVHGEAKLVVENGNPIATTFVAQ